MSVDVNNIFNSDEDKVQYALGLMKIYSVVIKEGDCKYYNDATNSYTGIIAHNSTQAVGKIFDHFSGVLQSGHANMLSIQANICE